MNARFRDFAVAALLLVFVVPTRGLDAPANREPNRGAWSESVGGLRAKAVADQPVFTLGDDLRLFVMMQNVSDQPIGLPGLRIMPTAGLAQNDHPFGKRHSYNAMVIGRPTDKHLSITWASRSELAQTDMIEPPLAPGEIRPVVIRLTTGGNAAMEMSQLFPRGDGVIREKLVLAAAIDPGEIELTFLLDTLGLADRGDAQSDLPAIRLQTPPIRVHAKEARAVEMQAQALPELARMEPAIKNDGWSDTFRGLRIKPVVSDLTFAPGDDLVLFVMMQNTTDRLLTIPGPLLTSQTRAPVPEQVEEAERSALPLGKGFNSQLTVEPAEARAEQIHGGLQPIANAPTPIPLEPGDTHVLIVRMTTGQAELMQQPPASPDETREGVHLHAVGKPGLYELRFSYAPDGLNGEHAAPGSPWAGHRFNCPEILIEAGNRVSP